MAAEIHELEQRITMLLRQREADWSASNRKSAHMRLVVKQLEVELDTERAALAAERARTAQLKDHMVDQLYFADGDATAGSALAEVKVSRSASPVTVGEKNISDTSHRGSTASSGFGAVVLRKGDEEGDLEAAAISCHMKEPQLPTARKRTTHSASRNEVRRFRASSAENGNRPAVGFAQRVTRKLTRSMSFG